MFDFSETNRHTKYYDLIIVCNQVKYYFFRHLLSHIDYFDTCFDKKFKVNKDDNVTTINFDDEYADAINPFLNIIYGKEPIDLLPLDIFSVLCNLLDFILCQEMKPKIMYQMLCRLTSIEETSKLISIFNEETVRLSLSYLAHCSSDELINIFDKTINHDKHITSLQYCFFCVVFHEQLGPKIYPQIKLNKLFRNEVDEIKKYYQHNYLIYLFDKIKAGLYKNDK